MKSKKLILKVIIVGMLIGMGVSNSSAFAAVKQVKICNALRNPTFKPGDIYLACEPSYKNKTTLKKMYRQGWRYVGSVVIDDNPKLILEK